MTLSYTSYYGTKGELVKAFNLAEPFTVNDIHGTWNVDAGRMYTTDEFNAIMETWFDDTIENIYRGAMIYPGALSGQLADSLNSRITLDNEDDDREVNLVVYHTQRRGQIEIYPNGVLNDNTESALKYSFSYPEGSGGYDTRLSLEVDGHIYTDLETNRLGPGLDDFELGGIDRYNSNRYVPVLVRDYTGDHAFMVLEPVDGSGKKFIGLSLYGLAESVEPRTGLDRDFWSGISNDIPDKDGEGEGIVDINNRFAPRTAMNGLGVYPIAKADLQDFIKDLWTETFSEKFLKFVNGDVMNNIVSIRWFYGIGGSIPRTDAEVYIRLGNQSMKGDLGTQTVVVRPATSELMTYTLGSLLIPRKYNNFLDLSPFTRLQIFVPYVGFVNLDMTEFAGRRLRLDYNINIVSGAAIAYIYVQNSDGSWRIAHEQATSIGVEIPLSVNSRESIGSRMATVLAGTAATAGGAAVGSLLGPVGAIGGAMAGHGVSQEILNSGAQTASNAISGLSSTIASSPSSRNGGGIDNETGSLGEFQPSVLITRPKAIPPSDYNMMVGLPDNNSGKVGSFNGYIKAGAIKQSAVSGLPRQVMDEIDQMLRAGVYTQ